MGGHVNGLGHVGRWLQYSRASRWWWGLLAARHWGLRGVAWDSVMPVDEAGVR